MTPAHMQIPVFYVDCQECGIEDEFEIEMDAQVWVLEHNAEFHEAEAIG